MCFSNPDNLPSVDENSDLSSKEFQNKEVGNFHNDIVFFQVTVFELR